jgi:hypothetical protein
MVPYKEGWVCQLSAFLKEGDHSLAVVAAAECARAIVSRRARTLTWRPGSDGRNFLPQGSLLVGLMVVMVAFLP